MLRVKKDLEELDINLDFLEFAWTAKSELKRTTKEKLKTAALKYLLSVKENHSKSKDLKYENLQLQEYLKPNFEISLTIQEKQFIFTARSRMMDVKVNFKLGQKDLLCRACRKADENQQHLLECERLSQFDLVTRLSFQYQDLFK